MDELKDEYLEHQCESIPEIGISVIYDDQLQYHHSWKLNIHRSVTESDLEENHIYEEIGELMWSTAVNISHCPYCGVDLYGISKTKVVGSHQFVHHDHSNWDVIVK
ncbi:MAG: hypothetical protein JKY88_17785 [Pseudomonadales bacterium]|nr:hypothetical protein [Pseudomonadales bacterium]